MCIYVIQNPCIKYLDNVFIFWCLPRLWQISQSGASLLFSACLYASIAAKLIVIKTKAPQEEYDLYMKSVLLSYPACASQAETGSGPSAWCYPHCWGSGCCKPRPGTRDISNTLTIQLQTKVIRMFPKISQSRRRPLLGPSPGWKRFHI